MATRVALLRPGVSPRQLRHVRPLRHRDRLPKRETTTSPPTRLFLDAVEQVKVRPDLVLASFVIDVLRGSKSKKIMKWRCEQIAAHGSGKDLSKEEWQQLVDQFMIQDLIVPVGNFEPPLPAGKDVLEGAEVRGIAPVRKKAQPSERCN